MRVRYFGASVGSRVAQVDTGNYAMPLVSRWAVY